MKTIKITQSDINKNQHILKGKTVGDIISFSERNFPKVWNNSNVNYKQNLEHFGFKIPVKPELQANEKYGSILEVNGDFIFDIEQIPQPTVEELHNRLLSEGKLVFDEFRRHLNEAAGPYNILGNHPQDLKDLTQAMLAAKNRILNELDTHLANNDLEKLKSFTYQTEEAEQLKQAIESFK